MNELIKLFGDDNVLLVTSKEMSNMYTNVFSISKNIIISDPRFIRLNDWLEKNDFTVEKVAYTMRYPKWVVYLGVPLYRF